MSQWCSSIGRQASFNALKAAVKVGDVLVSQSLQGGLRARLVYPTCNRRSPGGRIELGFSRGLPDARGTRAARAPARRPEHSHQPNRAPHRSLPSETPMLWNLHAWIVRRRARCARGQHVPARTPACTIRSELARECPTIHNVVRVCAFPGTLIARAEVLVGEGKQARDGGGGPCLRGERCRRSSRLQSLIHLERGRALSTLLYAFRAVRRPPIWPIASSPSADSS